MFCLSSTAGVSHAAARPRLAARAAAAPAGGVSAAQNLGFGGGKNNTKFSRSRAGVRLPAARAAGETNAEAAADDGKAAEVDAKKFPLGRDDLTPLPDLRELGLMAGTVQARPRLESAWFSKVQPNEEKLALST